MDGKSARRKLHRKRWISYAVSVLLLWAFGANACVIFTTSKTPELREVASAADIVAVIHVDRVGWRTSEEEAEFHRLWEHPPMNTPFSYPAQSAYFSVKRIFKGQIPANASILSSAISCGVSLAEGRDYVLFANLSSIDDRLAAWDSTFPLGATDDSAAKLADVESFFTQSNTPSP